MAKSEVKRPLCFVLMPFGKKTDGAGKTIDFDDVYKRIIQPAVKSSGLEPLRADEEKAGGIIHKPMFERLVLCEYAVADLTLANANVFYELGVRHAIRSQTTVLLYADGSRLPFDVSPLRAIPYHLNDSGKVSEPDSDQHGLKERLKEARTPSVDSPLFQLLDGFEPPDIQHLKTDVFRERVDYAEGIKAKLRDARRVDEEAIKAIEDKLGALVDVETGVLIDLLLSYRAVSAWAEMVRLAEIMPPVVAETVMVQEQYALALNRCGKGEHAEEVAKEVIARHGPSSETYGILGRIYKDRWEEATKVGNTALAGGLLKQAKRAYLAGFEADWRDAYPGINAVTLMELSEPRDEQIREVLPVVLYSVRRKIEKGSPDYWDHATLLELSVLNNDKSAAAAALEDALSLIRETWEPKTTLRNLRLIREARERRGQDTSWQLDIEEQLGKGIGT